MDQQTLIIVIIAIIVVFFIINRKNEEKENFEYINKPWANYSGVPRPTSAPYTDYRDDPNFKGARGPNNDSRLCCALDFLDFDYNSETGERGPQFDDKDAPDWDYEKNHQGANDRNSLLKIRHWYNVIRPLAGCPKDKGGEGPICQYKFLGDYCKLDQRNLDKARFNCWEGSGWRDIREKIKRAAGCNWGWMDGNVNIIGVNNKICKKHRTNTAMLPEPTPPPAPTPPPPPPPPPAPPVEISFADWHFKKAPRIGGSDGTYVLPRKLSEKECCPKQYYKNESGDCEPCPDGTWVPSSYYKEDIKKCTNTGKNACKPLPPCMYWTGLEFDKLQCPPGEYCPLSGKDKGKCVPKPTPRPQKNKK